MAACSSEPQDFAEATIADLQDRMHRGELTSEQLVRWYLQRIETVDRLGPTLNAILEINPAALQSARALDEERRQSGPRGPMHGIPVILKANIDTADRMHTSAGSLALANHRPAVDAFVVTRLREAGAVILGKANLSEWANFRSTRSSSGWSSIGGQTRNPYDVSRNPCGSSSGSAVSVAANLTVVAVGTETDGSVVCPSGINGIVGIKPTLGLISRSGIIPIAHSQDTAGPMARSVRDAAILLGAMTGVDDDDPASANPQDVPADFTANLTADGLSGKRIGVIRSYFGAGSNPSVEAILEASIEALKSAGAEVVESIQIDTSDMDEAEYTVLLYEFKDDLNRYLATSGAPLRSLADIIEFNDANSEVVMPVFDQDIMLDSQSKGPLTDDAYLQALATSKRVARSAIDDTLAEHQLDALIAPTNGPAWLTDHINGDTFRIGSSSLAAVSGYPSVTVPAGFVSHLPIGLSFMGRANSDKQLIEIAYAFEQLTAVRRAPEL
ncbi:MAG: amidase [Gammaproteobacteria bacterium]|nr:amidase [Gammaproteobacteria bacterium]MDH3432229.1 amidase [Gammaproteobacteria bacterium]